MNKFANIVFWGGFAIILLVLWAATVFRVCETILEEAGFI